jgi:hypothetical protein
MLEGRRAKAGCRHLATLLLVGDQRFQRLFVAVELAGIEGSFTIIE